MARSNELTATIWRRGRGPLNWKFIYIVHGDKPWFSTPGWYHFARKFVYRITFDHDYPARPVWLGRKGRGKTWINTEGLYDPIAIHHNTIIVGNRLAGLRRVHNNGVARGTRRVVAVNKVLNSQWRNA